MRFQRFAPIALLFLVAVMLASALLPALAYEAQAHASLVRANPANNETLRRPPTRVVLHFSEPLEQRLTEIQVRDQNDARVDRGVTAFDENDPAFASVGLEPLEPGLYFVRWTNVSRVDGHQLQGTYPFIVLNPDGTFPAGVSLDSATAGITGDEALPSTLDAALKWLALLSLVLVAGAAFYLLAVLRPAAAFLDDDEYHKVTDMGERWVVTLSHVLLPLSFIAAAFLVLVTWNRFATDTSLWTYLTSVRTGEYRLAGLTLVLVGLAGADLLFLGSTARKRNIGLGVLLLAGAAAMLTYSMISHASAGPGRYWAIVSDYIHFGASAVWLGALVMLPGVFRWAKRNLDEQTRFLYLANMFDRFSIFAGISVAAVLATGVFNALAAVPSMEALTDTTYGRVLIVKLIIVVPLLVVAGLNAWVLKPRLVATIDGLYQQGGRGTDEERAAWSSQLASLQRSMPRTIIAEVALVVAVFASVGVLTQTSTAGGELAQRQAEEAQGTPFNQTAEVDGLRLTLDVRPNRVGINEYGLLIEDETGTPIETVTQARLRFTYDSPDSALSPSELILNRFAPGDYRGAGAYFTQPGNWRVELGLRRSDADDVSRTFVLPVIRTEVSTYAAEGGALSLPFDSFTWNEIAGAFLVFIGVMVLLYRKQLRGLQTVTYRASVTGAVAFLLAGGVLAFGVHTHQDALDAQRGNPVEPTEASVERGRTLFQQNCIMCHGVDGRGEGPEAAQLNPQPTDFRLHMPLHTDPQFYAFIANGYPGSAMPAFRDAFSEEDIWNLVNFLRAEFSEAPTE